MSTVAERVARGVALLDAHYGTGWVERIDLGRLNITSACDCILGQIYTDFAEGLETLGIWRSIENGFNAKFGTADAIESAWRRVIAERRAREVGT